MTIDKVLIKQGTDGQVRVADSTQTDGWRWADLSELVSPDPPAIYAAMINVMVAVGAVGKTGRNASQGYNFRGVDAVVNAVNTALTDHGVGVVPDKLLSVKYREFTSGKSATLMHECTVKVRYRFFTSDGSSVYAEGPGESADSGDKSTAKAMSIAYRTMLLQTFCIRTDDPDPDEQSYERVASPPAEQGVIANLLKRMNALPEVDDYRPHVKQDFVRHFGTPAELRQSKAAEAQRFVEEAERLAPQVHDTAESEPSQPPSPPDGSQDPEPAQSDPEPDRERVPIPPADPDESTIDVGEPIDWVAQAKEAGVTQSAALGLARQLADGLGFPLPSNLRGLPVDEQFGVVMFARLVELGETTKAKK